MNKTKFDKLYNNVLDDMIKEGYIEELEGGFKITAKGVAEYERKKEYYERLANETREEMTD